MAVSLAADEKQRNNCFTGYVDATAVSLKNDILLDSRLPLSDELELLVKSPKDKKKVKKLVRTSDWPVNHEIRRSLWVTLCSAIDSFKAASDDRGYRETVQEIFGNGDVEIQINQLPSFVDCSNMVQHYLTDGGVKAVYQILSVIAHERPDITYSPLLFTLTAILLHYVDEAACYTCVSSLVISKHGYIAQTMISHKAQSLTLSELSSKYVKSWYQLVLRNGYDVNAVLANWQRWIFKELPFPYMLRVVDCYLYEGPKVLYRVVLAILICYHRHASLDSKEYLKNFTSASDIDLAIQRFCAEIPVSVGKLLKIAFGIRALSRSKLHRLIARMEVHAQSKQDVVARPSLTVFPGQLECGEILSRDVLKEVYQWLPRRFTLNQPKLIYSTSEHGTSLSTFFNKVTGHEPTFIVIKTDQSEVIGAFCSVDWGKRPARQAYFGTGESFVCKLFPTCRCYSWVGLQLGENTPHSAQLFMLADSSQISIGGGGGCAITMNEDLLHGRSEHCETFDNEPLVASHNGIFAVAVMEVFAFYQ